MARIFSPVAPRRPGAGPRVRKRPQAAHDMVMRGIGLDIVSGHYPAGSLLPAKEILSRQFKVSNSTLREALQKLSSKGMIHPKTRVGTRILAERHWNMFDADILDWRFAAGVDRSFLAHLFTLRQAFEPMAAAIMATRRTEDSLRQLTQLAAQMTVAGQDRAAIAAADLAFHLLILESTGNPFLQSIGALIRTALLASFAMSTPDETNGHGAQAPHDHGPLVAAIAAGDAQAAADAMLAVIRAGWINLGGTELPDLATLRLGRFLA
ncbi:FadR family transcriptional regulator [Acidisoma cellulosilytica]|uniref:FadR family transcriptional regulator n=1 Tax=Acidisoma cellulosilyticum TaxID=2802395 RepID=A0A963Z082_9PROT|nr:FCD domain-containing protein [Acidisoma cellulosilyticum]MCB8879612.1 FadR family transcriptional regulator [Acidisoma cellulosilyticum]